MKDVSAWQILRRWDGLNELSSGRNEGVKTAGKKEKKTAKISLHRLCANEARNGGVWLKKEIIPSTFSLVKQ